MLFSRLSIGKKLGLGFLVLILLLVVSNSIGTVGLLAIRDRWEISEETEELHVSLMYREVEHLQWVMQLQDYLIAESVDNFSLQLDPTKCNLGQWLGSDSFDHLLEVYPKFAPEFQKLYHPHEQLHASAQTIKELLEKGDVAGAERVYYEHTLPSLAQTRGILGQVRSDLDQDARQLGEDMRRLMSAIVVQILIVVALGVVLSIVISRLVTVSITKPLRVLKEAAYKIGTGDLGTSWKISSQDEIGDLSNSLLDMVNGLRRLV